MILRLKRLKAKFKPRINYNNCTTAPFPPQGLPLGIPIKNSNNRKTVEGRFEHEKFRQRNVLFADVRSRFAYVLGQFSNRFRLISG